MTVKVGIMSFAHLHADSYALCLKQHPQAELVGIADHDATRAKAKAHQFETQAFNSYEALLASDVQAVIICSRTPSTRRWRRWRRRQASTSCARSR